MLYPITYSLVYIHEGIIKGVWQGEGKVHMNRKLEIVLYSLMFFCTMSVIVVRFILHKNSIAAILSVVLCCLYCLICKLEKK